MRRRASAFKFIKENPKPTRANPWQSSAALPWALMQLAWGGFGTRALENLHTYLKALARQRVAKQQRFATRWRATPLEHFHTHLKALARHRVARHRCLATRWRASAGKFTYRF